MKKKVLVVAGLVTLIGGTALYAASQQRSTGQRPAQTQSRQAKPPATATMVHPLAGEFVSYNATTKMLTVKDIKGQSSSARLEGKATNEVTSFKPGDWLTLTWREEKGQRMAVINLTKGTKPAA